MIPALPRDASWLAANQSYLAFVLAKLRARIERRLQSAGATSRIAEPTLHSVAGDSMPSSALSLLCAKFGLSSFERDLLLLCAGPELDTGFASLLQGAGLPRVTFGTALSLLDDGHWSALLPTSALRSQGLIELDPHDSLTQTPLRLPERILHYLCGLEYSAQPVEAERLRLDDLAQRIDSTLSYSDLVLPEEQLAILKQVAMQRRQRSKVYDTWGFAEKSTRGLGLTVLFHGPSGTGKTMAAEVLANDLGLTLYRVDLSQVVNKYIGETEKNLRRIFDAAEADHVVLLFDEADALFGKRSEVKDSRDRYANLEVSYLLSRMESFQGLSILTSNLKNALDHAFLRRLRFVVEFPFPSTSLREEIWRRTFPPRMPVGQVDYARLAQLKVTGGTIRNIVLNAAFLAADADEPIAMPHLLQSARSEYSKLERPLTEVELGGWT